MEKEIKTGFRDQLRFRREFIANCHSELDSGISTNLASIIVCYVCFDEQNIPDSVVDTFMRYMTTVSADVSDNTQIRLFFRVQESFDFIGKQVGSGKAVLTVNERSIGFCVVIRLCLLSVAYYEIEHTYSVDEIWELVTHGEPSGRVIGDIADGISLDMPMASKIRYVRILLAKLREDIIDHGNRSHK